MSVQDTLRDSLEDFSARALATEASDAARICRLRQNLATMLKSLEAGSPSGGLLTLGLAALDAIDTSKHPQTSRLLDAVAAATAAVVRDMSGESDANAIRSAADVLKALLAGDHSRPSQSANPQVSPQTPQTSTAGAPAVTSLESDPELIRDFIAESCDRLAAAEAALLVLEAAPEDKEQIHTVLRAFHTVKGASGFLGLDKIQQLAHMAENLLIQARDGQLQIAGKAMDCALESCDVLRGMVKALEPGAKESFDSSRIAGLVERLSASEAPTGENRDWRRQTAAEPALTFAAPAARSEIAPSVQPVAEETESPEDASEPQETQRSPAGSTARLVEGVRVNAERLDELVNMVGELVIAQSIITQSTSLAARADIQLARSVSHAGKILRSLQDLALGLRMVPLRATFTKMARLVRDLAHKSGKSVQLVTSGEDTEIDRNMVEVLSDPLVHMIRNAVDHGIESQEDRVRDGKAHAGTIHLRAYHSAGNVVIELQDDGRGLNRSEILAQAVQRSLAKDQELSDAQVYSLIFLPGLSTARQVTDVSGRGVGMDVVKRNVDSLRGKIEVRSEQGKGSTFTLRLPLTLAIADAMVLTVGAERFLLPTISIEHSFRPREGMMSTVTGRGEMVSIRGQLLPVFRLHRLFGIEGAIDDPAEALLIVIEGAGRRCAILVDDLLGQQQVVIKPLGKVFSHIPGVSGGAILGDGRVGLILDAAGLVQLSHGQARAA